MYKSVQVCRAVAALLVVLYHLGAAVALDKYFGVQHVKQLFSFGDAGVEFFFVLSGFIITWVHSQDFGRLNRLPAYLWKRSVRIYPTYWIILGSVLVFFETTTGKPSELLSDFSLLIKTLSLLPQDTSVTGGTGAPVLIVAWTLQFEMLFYAVMAVFIMNRALGGLLVTGLLVNYAVCHLYGCLFPFNFFASNWVLLFGFGVLIAFICKSAWQLHHPLTVVIASTVAFLGVGVFEVVMGKEALPIDRRFVYGFISGLLILGLVRSEDTGKLRVNSKWMLLLGDASYALYLLHLPLISALCKAAVFVGLSGLAGALLAAPVILAACIFASVFFYQYVEKPLLHVLRFPGKKPAVANSAVG